MSEHPHPIPNEWLTLYYDGELDLLRRDQVEGHLPVCLSCQQELAALKGLSSLLAVDRLGNDIFESRSVRSMWTELEPRLPERAAAAPSLLRWLPGFGLLIANVVVQFITVVSVTVMLAGSQLGWIAQLVDWLDGALSDWLLGWTTWLLPVPSSGFGLSLFLILLSAWLAVLYVAWLGHIWLDRRQPVAQMGTL
jgi:hypothetical protein